MKEMEYKWPVPEQKYEILDEGYYKDYHYMIVSFFTYPCAYVELPKDHAYYDKDYDEIPIYCHWGLSYLRHYLLKNCPDYRAGYWIGWDYGHAFDYASYFSEEEAVYINLRKWTTTEIIEEVKLVIEQLIAKED